MPGLNKSGPEGNGPLTGRGMGNCNIAVPDSGNLNAQAERFRGGLGRKRRNRRGAGYGVRKAGAGGYGRRQSFTPDKYPPQDTAGEIDMLKKQAESILNTLDTISAP